MFPYVESFYHLRVLNLSNALPAWVEVITRLLSYILLTRCVTSVFIGSIFCAFSKEIPLVCGLQMCCWFLFNVFASVFLQDICFLFSFLVVSLSGLVSGDAGLLKDESQLFPSSLLLEENCIPNCQFVTCFVEYIRGAIWSRVFLCRLLCDQALFSSVVEVPSDFPLLHGSLSVRCVFLRIHFLNSLPVI